MTKSRALRVAAVAVLAVSVLTAPPAGAATQMKQLGIDPALDAPYGADLAALLVASHGGDLHLRIELAGALPVQGSYPGAGIEWSFDVRGRTFVAEGHPEAGGEFLYTLYEVVDETFTQLAQLEGNFDAGLLDMYIPLREIGARKGTRISGTGTADDVDIHQHAGPVSPLLDTMSTTSDYIVP